MNMFGRFIAVVTAVACVWGEIWELFSLFLPLFPGFYTVFGRVFSILANGGHNKMNKGAFTPELFGLVKAETRAVSSLVRFV